MAISTVFLLHCPCTSVTWQGNLVRHGYKYSISLNVFHPQVSSFNNSYRSFNLFAVLTLILYLLLWTVKFKEVRYAKIFVLFRPGNTQISALNYFMHIKVSLANRTTL